MAHRLAPWRKVSCKDLVAGVSRTPAMLSLMPWGAVVHTSSSVCCPVLSVVSRGRSSPWSAHSEWGRTSGWITEYDCVNVLEASLLDSWEAWRSEHVCLAASATRRALCSISSSCLGVDGRFWSSCGSPKMDVCFAAATAFWVVTMLCTERLVKRSSDCSAGVAVQALSAGGPS